jgi:tRNA threonylcarbamoyladenosine biosynthesis protein TsaB
VYLAIDTSTKFGGVALCDAGVIVRSQSWFTRHNHTVELMPAVQRLFEHQGLGIRDVQGIGVSQGPGGFSAVRAGLSVAKGLAFPLSIPVVGCSSLESIAYVYRCVGFPICPVTELGRDLLGWAYFATTEHGWERITPDRVGSTADFIHAVRRRHTVFCGDPVGILSSALNEAMGDRAHLIINSGGLDRLQGLAEVSSRRLGQGEADSIYSLSPHYLRPPGITQPNPPRRVRQ